MSINPPKKRDWTKGKHQIGLFVRFPDGAVIEVTASKVDAMEVDAASKLLKLLSRGVAERGSKV